MRRITSLLLSQPFTSLFQALVSCGVMDISPTPTVIIPSLPPACTNFKGFVHVLPQLMRFLIVSTCVIGTTAPAVGMPMTRGTSLIANAKMMNMLKGESADASKGSANQIWKDANIFGPAWHQLYRLTTSARG
jgi:hypothetical protein